MFYILISMHVTTLKLQHPLFELFHSYLALSVTPKWGCNGHHVMVVDCQLNQENFNKMCFEFFRFELSSYVDSFEFWF